MTAKPTEHSADGSLRDWMQSGLFAGVDQAAIAALSDRAQRLDLPAGNVLVRQGDSADSLYFLETGRLRVLIETPAGRKAVAQIEAGEPVGELAFFGGGTRTATLQASRDSVVMVLDRQSYDAVVSEFPQLVPAILTAVTQRLAAVTAKTPPMEARLPRVIAVVPCGSSRIDPGVLDRLADAVRRTVPDDRQVMLVRESDVPQGPASAYQAWLREHEARRGYLLIDAGGDPEWGSLVCRNADGLLMVAEAGASPTLNPLEQVGCAAIEPANRTLLVLRDAAGRPIGGTAAWLAGRDPHLHHHVATDSEADFRRVARFLTGRAVGLVLAGGGALGCAHLGIVRGLQQAGIPIDLIGGTSAGAAMGAAIAQGLSVPQTLDQMEAMFIDAKAMRRFTVPIHSLLDPAVFDTELEARYGAADIADQPINFFAISTNLSTNDLHVHRRGPLWHAVRASGSLPTILPPFIDSDGNILVDGGVLDNVPVVTMRALKSGPNIVVTLGEAGQVWRIKAAYQSLRRRGQLIRDVLLRRKSDSDFPSIVEIMQRSMVVASRIASRSMLREDDIPLSPPIVQGMQILDWHLGRKQAEQAAHYVAQEVASNPVLASLAAQPD
ncbi:cyclic nucleotide-binding and patatin-like phospholipase domain-containing protein [Blastomonas sp. AAP53]|uniref:cyclic nucleotide-binding and patatin-like phospholipase domain-containing protein n=1 Tax=Blastomonas sp. AAP53 TaxID=1248760 RepID=UPI0002FB0231|nr:cyclic nucleotide-binding and patatin-like phospholipase domain-containing protein [Blastomonas sp. AAP53]